MTGSPSWSVDKIAYDTLRPRPIGDDRRLFHLVASASFIEITSSVYTRNLIDHFRCDQEIVDWLERAWEPEEVQHGRALKRYVQTVWPEFDWEGAYGVFLAEYMPLCTAEQLAATRALEMASRCVVETGTAAFYRMLSTLCSEPVLCSLAASISADEVRHYKHFYRYFLRYQAVERPRRTTVMRALWHRMMEIEAEDAYCAFKAVYLTSNPGNSFDRSLYDSYRADVLQLMKRHLPFGMATKMLLKPLGLNAAVGRAMAPAIASAARFYVAAAAG